MQNGANWQRRKGAVAWRTSTNLGVSNEKLQQFRTLGGSCGPGRHDCGVGDNAGREDLGIAMRPTSGSEVWMKADLASILRALWLATLAARGDGEYARGYAAALATVAAALGIADYEVSR
jgi:hypothetical protein